MRASARTQPDGAPDDFDDEPLERRRTIAELVAEDVMILEPTATLREAAVALRTADVSLAVVGDAQEIAGVVSERDIVSAIARGTDLDQTAVSSIESESLKWATPNSTVDDVAEEMLGAYVRHILIRHDDGSLAGIVSMRDLLTAFLI